VIVPAVVALAFLVLPLLALAGRADWTTFWADITSAASLQSLWLSIWTATLATVVCAILGLPLAVFIAGLGRRWAAVLRAVTTIPLLLPPMVGGVALLYLLGRNGWLGRPFEAWGWQIPFTSGAVVVAESFVALPFLVIAAESAIRGLDRELVDAAATMGASSWQTFRWVTAPLAGPAIAAGLTLTFARAMGEFGATALFAGNAQGVTRTMPLAIYTAFNGSGTTQAAAIAMSLILFVVALAVLVVARGWRVDSVR